IVLSTVKLSSTGTMSVVLFSAATSAAAVDVVTLLSLDTVVVLLVSVFLLEQPAAKTTVAITRSIAIIFNIFFINYTSKVLFLFYTQLIYKSKISYEIFM